jgi:hypothetical protein
MASKFWQTVGAGLSGFAEGFNRTYPQALQMAQQERLAEMRMDAEMGIRGFERMNDFETKQYNANQKLLEKTKGYATTEGGAVIPPKGTKAVEGQFVDKQGNVVGEYAPGNESKPLANQIQKTGDVFNVGGNYYRWNPELAQRMGAEGMASEKDLRDMRDKIKASFPTARGNWVPSTVRMGGSTYRYQPTLQEQSPEMAFQDWQANKTNQVNPQGVATQTPSPLAQTLSSVTQVNPMTLQVRQAVQNAISKNIPRNDIIKGIQDEGMNPNDFADLLGTYDEKTSSLRRTFLGDILTGAGLGGLGVVNMIQALSSMIDEKKKQLKQKANMNLTGTLQQGMMP